MLLILKLSRICCARVVFPDPVPPAMPIRTLCPAKHPTTAKHTAIIRIIVSNRITKLFDIQEKFYTAAPVTAFENNASLSPGHVKRPVTEKGRMTAPQFPESDCETEFDPVFLGQTFQNGKVPIVGIDEPEIHHFFSVIMVHRTR